MNPWHVRVESRVVAKCASADIAHAVVQHLWLQDGVYAEVVFSEGVRFK